MDGRALPAKLAPDCLGAVVTDGMLTITEVSDGVLDLSGYSRSDLIGLNVIEIVHPDDLARAAEVLDEMRATSGPRPDGLYRLRLANRSYRDLAVRANNTGPGENSAIIFEFRDPTPQMRAESLADDIVDVTGMLSENLSLEDSIDWVAKVAERHVAGLRVITTTFDPDGPNHVVSRHEIPEEIARVNAAARPDRLPPHVAAAIEASSGRAWRWSRRIAAVDAAVPGRLTSVLRDRAGNVVGYVEVLRADDGEPDDAEWSVHRMTSRMMTAVLQRHELDRQLRYAADHDPLTGLVNRRRLFELLEKAEDLVGSLLYVIDLDHFSWVNNNLGHQAGDRVLIRVADSLRELCPANAVVARLGGDEFVVWVPGGADVADLSLLGRQMSDALIVPSAGHDRRETVRLSIGMVTVQAGESINDAMGRADSAMYVSKRQGGARAIIG